MKQMLLVITTVFLSSAQIIGTLNISGKVTNRDGVAIAGAEVILPRAGKKTYTNENGEFVINENSTKSATNKNNNHSQIKITKIERGLVTLCSQNFMTIKFDLFTINGQKMTTLKKDIGPGINLVALPKSIAGIYLLKATVNKREYVYKCTQISDEFYSISLSTPATLNRKQEKKAEYIYVYDLLVVKKEGFINYDMATDRYDTNGFEIKMIECAGSVTDIDGNVYQTIKIGNQVWTTENLRTTRLNDGTILKRTDNLDGIKDTAAYTYRFNKVTPDTIKTFGAHYNLDAIITGKLPPPGWQHSE